MDGKERESPRDAAERKKWTEIAEAFYWEYDGGRRVEVKCGNGDGRRAVVRVVLGEKFFCSRCWEVCDRIP